MSSRNSLTWLVQLLIESFTVSLFIREGYLCSNPNLDELTEQNDQVCCEADSQQQNSVFSSPVRREVTMLHIHLQRASLPKKESPSETIVLGQSTSRFQTLFVTSWLEDSGSRH